ncbi:NifB/NifX family molybdenum-iron cluster-binding protein [Thiohalomonas denitrificans]|uniref:NifB/NifX family molybdenum-iron cluster-binding protein n=1 Tax=Thiohalomonas denitrificans TaxID=415747 RepID=UPI0026F1C3DF|nr:NifB/NifX family molybdenum-iron cluster-binding protein [Thiohalomonas denitrificans]
MKIAVTSQNFRTVTGHAGKTRRFLVYDSQVEGEPDEIQRIDLPKGMAFHDYHGDDPHPVDVADVIITGGCGQGFVNRMAARGIRVVATSETDPMRAVKAIVHGEPLPPPEPHAH